MQIPLNVILYRLSPNIIFETQHVNLSENFDGVKLFDVKEVAPTEKRHIYLMTEGMLRCQSIDFLKQQHFSDHVFICLAPGNSVTINDFHKDLSVVLVYTDESFPVFFNKLLNIFHDFDTWDKEFHLKLLKGCSLQDLLNLSSSILNHPMVILDRNYSLLGYIRSKDPLDLPDPFMEELVTSGYVTPEAMLKLQQDGLISTSEKAANPLINYYCLTDKNCYYSMMYRFVSNHNIVGYALVMRCTTHPNTNYLYLMNIVYENLKLYFQQDRFANRASSEIYEAVLTDILENPALPEQQIIDQVRYIPDLEMEGRFILAKINYTGTTDLPHSFVSWNIRNALPALKPFVCHNSLYVLKDNSKADDCGEFLSAADEKIFRSIFRNHAYSCGISHTFFTLSDLGMAARQCDDATRLGVQNYPDFKNYYYFSDVTMFYLMEHLENTMPVKTLLSPYYQVLKEYDQAHSSDLCYVFTEFLLTSKSINNTANKIFMHRNTVLNKVKKATSIMKHEFDDYQSQLAFVMAHMKAGHNIISETNTSD